MSSRKWCVMDLVVGRDGKLVLTKVQAATFHLFLALTVASITIVRLWKYATGVLPLTAENWLFDLTMWGLYAAVAVGHAVVDKTGTQVTNYKMAELAAPAVATATTSSTTTVTGPVTASEP